MDKKSPGQKPDKTGKTRDDRLKQALKANLARRKAQTKARNANAGAGVGASADDQDKGKG
jgi:hypothetical protein